MKKYNIKNITDYTPIEGFNLIESILFKENNFEDPFEIVNTFPDLYVKSWLAKFLNSELKPLTGSIEFSNYVSENKDKRYTIIGDYDADGIMATTIMNIALKTFGVSQINYVIPDRLEDGYGIKEKHIDKAVEIGTDVIITVDNGISANKSVEYAKSKGMFVIITDHHIPDMNNLPDANLIINPHVSGESFPNICGAFVALKLAVTLLDPKIKENEYVLRDLAIFAAVATISDVMPLIKENRSLVKYALDTVNFYKNRNNWAGRLLKFLSGFGVNKKIIQNEKINITEDSFGFYVGPVLNATGRVNGEVEQIVQDIINAGDYGNFINGYYQINRERQEKTKEIFKEYEPGKNKIGYMFIESGKYDYPIAGLVGLVANRISDKEQKPALVGSKKNDYYSFSCRSVPGYSLYDGLQRFFEKYPDSTVEGGGHDGAIGIRLTDEKEIELLKEHFTDDFSNYTIDTSENILEYDEMYFNEIFDAHYNLFPFGHGFKKVKFHYKGVLNKEVEGYNEIFVNNLFLKTFIPKNLLPDNGETVDIIFTVQTESVENNIFKIEEIKKI